MITIRDNGVGFDKEARARLFEPYVTTKSNGTGLGLAVSYGIIERHSGRLEVYSEPGQGSTFVIRLPIKQDTLIPS